MGVCNCSMFCCTLLYVHSSIAIILMGKRELVALLNLSSWCLVMVERLFLAVPRGKRICTEKRLNTSLKDLSIALNNHGRHGLFSFLSSFPISVLRYLELEANKHYDRANKLYKAALLTRCYVQHFLSPYIDSEVNHKRHFIKIPFINKGM